jgi:hypothetical protein
MHSEEAGQSLAESVRKVPDVENISSRFLCTHQNRELLESPFLKIQLHMTK